MNGTARLPVTRASAFAPYAVGLPLITRTNFGALHSIRLALNGGLNIGLENKFDKRLDYVTPEWHAVVMNELTKGETEMEINWDEMTDEEIEVMMESIDFDTFQLEMWENR
jgi:hypothetical protein